MNIYLDSVGCRLNQSEIEKIAMQFLKVGHSIVASAEDADIVIVNTCVVTAAAASDSRQKVRQAARKGKAGIVVTGCWATYDPKGAGELPNVTRVIENYKKDALVKQVLEEDDAIIDREPFAREPLPGIHKRTRAFTKVQDGCDNHCTYCITRLVRGKSRSVALENILKDVSEALAGGVKEIVLCGVHLGAWGQEISPPSHLKQLVKTILRETDIPRLRLSSLEPWDLTPDFFQLWEDERLCRHLHLPLQSGSMEVLRMMGRRIMPEQYANLVEAARKVIPDLAVTTDIIVGFPGETDAHFEQSKLFVQALNFSGGHVFNYSARPGTPAASYPSQIPHDVRKKRSIEMRNIFEESSKRFHHCFLGREMEVLWESVGRMTQHGCLVRGLTSNYLRVGALAQEKLWNQLSVVRLDKMSSDGLFGEIVKK